LITPISSCNCMAWELACCLRLVKAIGLMGTAGLSCLYPGRVFDCGVAVLGPATSFLLDSFSLLSSMSLSCGLA
jgi:hypothetical protein